MRYWLETALRSALEHRRVRASGPATIPVGVTLPAGHLESVLLHADGVVAAEGWASDLAAFRQALRLTIAGATLEPTHAYRIRAATAAAQFRMRSGFIGAVSEWILDVDTAGSAASIESNGARLISFNLPPWGQPAYSHLRNEPAVLGRENIYGSGRPVRTVSPEIMELARTLPSPVLDFGCGSGALVYALRRAGVEAHGLELDTARIRDDLIEEARPFVTLYDGSLPAPFPAGAFASVACCEVLEHIPEPERAVAELARLARERLLVTVPDASAIPRGFRHDVVPWHLLEGTHVNFFTQQSLERLVTPVASRLEAARIGVVHCDRVKFFTSVAVLADR